MTRPRCCPVRPGARGRRGWWPPRHGPGRCAAAKVSGGARRATSPRRQRRAPGPRRRRGRPPARHDAQQGVEVPGVRRDPVVLQHRVDHLAHLLGVRHGRRRRCRCSGPRAGRRHRCPRPCGAGETPATRSGPVVAGLANGPGGRGVGPPPRTHSRGGPAPRGHARAPCAPRPSGRGPGGPRRDSRWPSPNWPVSLRARPLRGAPPPARWPACSRRRALRSTAPATAWSGPARARTGRVTGRQGGSASWAVATAAASSPRADSTWASVAIAWLVSSTSPMARATETASEPKAWASARCAPRRQTLATHRHVTARSAVGGSAGMSPAVATASFQVRWSSWCQRLRSQSTASQPDERRGRREAAQRALP